jgi:hypothetical protein
MEKLKFKIIPHINLYRVSWLQKGQQVTATEQCLLSFQIGSFSEQVLCDMIEMDACHVLLGRQQMFDRKVFHNGRENSYEFFKDGKCYKLVPLLEKGMDNNDNKVMHNNNTKVMDNSNHKNMYSNKNRIMLCFAKDFIRENKQNIYCLAIMPKRIKETEKRNCIPTEIQHLLKKFKEIVGDNLPAGLPTLRSTSHQINLIP